MWHESCLIPSSNGLSVLSKYLLHLKGHMGFLCAWDSISALLPPSTGSFSVTLERK